MRSTLLLALPLLAAPLLAETAPGSREIDAVLPAAQALYADLHEHPELSAHETQTAATLADRLRQLGYDVTEHVGGTGVVALLRNGPGPTIMLRTELDALPVEERTGLAFASKVRAKDDAGHDVPVMHACGHDVHMASLVGTATVMAHSRGTWHGTLMLIGQPAEEIISGAQAMINDGLFTRFPKPDAGFALHVGNDLPAGQVGITPGVYNSNSDGLRITVYGKGGHGAQPHTTIDPIVIASRMIVTFQSIVAREVKPGEMAIVTVGYIQAGTKENIIPDRAEMGLTVRTFKPEVRKQVLEAITRIAKAEALAGAAPQEPRIEQLSSTNSVVNDLTLAQRLRAPLEAALGKQNVVTTAPITPSEDYAHFIEQGVPSLYCSLGGADPQKWAEARAAGTSLPSNHSPLFAPDAGPAIRTGIAAEVAVLRTLLQPGGHRAK